MPSRALIADSSLPLRRGLRFLVRREPDMQVVGEAADGPDAIRSAEHKRPDLLVLDRRLPPVVGMDVVASLRLACRSARFLVLTMHCGDAQLRAVAHIGTTGQLRSEEAVADVVTAIRQAGQEGRYDGPRLDAESAVSVLHEGMPTATGPKFALRELDMVRLAVAGYTRGDIASPLAMSPQTVTV